MVIREKIEKTRLRLSIVDVNITSIHDLSAVQLCSYSCAPTAVVTNKLLHGTISPAQGSPKRRDINDLSHQLPHKWHEQTEALFTVHISVNSEDNWGHISVRKVRLPGSGAHNNCIHTGHWQGHCGRSVWNVFTCSQAVQAGSLM